VEPTANGGITVECGAFFVCLKIELNKD